MDRALHESNVITDPERRRWGPKPRSSWLHRRLQAQRRVWDAGFLAALRSDAWLYAA